jgi:transposase
VVDTGRRRRWSDEEKLKIVLESLAAPRQVSATARRYSIARSQLLQWRRLFRPERNETNEQTSGFVPAVVVPDSERAWMRVTGAVDPTALKATVAALTGGKSR